MSIFKRVFILFSALLVLVSCTSNVKEDDKIQSDEESVDEQFSIIPSHQLTEEEYKIILPYRPSKARGAITNQIYNRLDIDEMEEGLRRHSTELYDPEKYLFEEGQYLSTDFIYTLIDELNPEIKDPSKQEDHEKNPRYLSHIVEQNYLTNDDGTARLAGISIGIAMKSVYRFQTDIGGPSYYENIPKNTMVSEGKKIAEEVLEHVREIEELENVPILIALYREEKQSSPIPGSFVMKTIVGKDQATIEKWEDINEKNVLFPSSAAKENHYEDHEKVKKFGDEIAQYFPNYVGVVGNGFYINNNLNTLSLEVPISFYGKGEVIGFTQYSYGLVKEIFPEYFNLEVKITSNDKVESLIYREAGTENPQVHIFN